MLLNFQGMKIPNGSELTGAELFARSLVRLGIRQIFTLVGDHLNEVLVAIRNQGIGIVDMRHESAVTHAADTWARVHRSPALALVTGGPGHTNSLTGLTGAELACSPVIAVAGGRPSNLVNRQAFQDIDQVGMARPVVRWSAEVPSTAEIPAYLARAYGVANSGRRGAVHLTVPADLFQRRAHEPLPWSEPAQAPAAPIDSQSLRAALDLLRECQRPVVIAGSGVWWANAADELQQFIEAAQVPLYTITFGRGVVSDEHPLCMGYADPALNRAALRAFQEADLFVVLGKRLDYRLALGGPRLFPAEARFIQVDIHPGELGFNHKLDAAICADLKPTLCALSDELDRAPATRGTWLNRVRSFRQEWTKHLESCGDGTTHPLHPAAFYRLFREVAPPDLLLAWDGGDAVHWGRAILPARVPGGWMRLGPLGGIGAALPNGIAMQLAHPDRRVAIITGDGSVGFFIAEMDTIVRYGLPVVIIVLNDAAWGLEREFQRASTGEETVSCELRPTRYDIVMRGFGGDGDSIDSLDQVRPALQRAFASPSPYCLNVHILGVRSPFAEWQILGKKGQG